MSMDSRQEFLKAMAGGIMERELMSLHGKLVRYGFKFSPQKIIGARPTSSTARNDQTLPMRVTYDSPKTKGIVVKAAKAADLWGYQERKGQGKIVFFRDVPNPKRNVQVKRKHEENPGEEVSKNPKRSRTDKTLKPEPASENREIEEVNEEKMWQKFVAKELKKEELEAEAKRAARRQQMVNEIEINVFLREQRNRAMVEETENEPRQDKKMSMKTQKVAKTKTKSKTTQISNMNM